MSDTETIPATEPPVSWVAKYVAACSRVLASANACLEVANLAVAARNKAAERPQHEISIQNFTDMAERSEHEFTPLYRTFADACTRARDTAASFLAQSGLDAEMFLMLAVEEDVLDNVATVKAILRANFAPTPAGFIEGVNQSNTFMQTLCPEGGNIYTPLPLVERTCPWCAETIKAAAIVCRYCGCDVQAQPSAD